MVKIVSGIRWLILGISIVAVSVVNLLLTEIVEIRVLGVSIIAIFILIELSMRISITIASILLLGASIHALVLCIPLLITSRTKYKVITWHILKADKNTVPRTIRFPTTIGSVFSTETINFVGVATIGDAFLR